MPIPKPKKEEKKNKFIKRCMESKIMKKEYSRNQRYAICLSKWEEKW